MEPENVINQCTEHFSLSHGRKRTPFSPRELLQIYNFQWQTKNLQMPRKYRSNYLEPKQNIIYERYVFNFCIQEPTEFSTKLPKQSLKFVTIVWFQDADKMLRDRLLIGTNHDNTRSRLLHEFELNLEKDRYFLEQWIGDTTTNQMQQLIHYTKV